MRVVTGRAADFRPLISVGGFRVAGELAVGRGEEMGERLHLIASRDHDGSRRVAGDAVFGVSA